MTTTSIINWKQFLIPPEKGGGSISGAVIHGKTPGGFSGLLRLGNRQDATVILRSSAPGTPIEAQLLHCSPTTGCERMATLKPVKGKTNRFRIQDIELDVNRASEDRMDVAVRRGSEGTVLHYYGGGRSLVTMGSEEAQQPSLMRGGSKIRVGRSQGYGIFATEDIRAGEIVEEAPVLSQATPFLTNYAFSAGDSRNMIALGNISLYNHSDTPTCSHSLDSSGSVMTLTATRDIPAGSELSISYGGSLWFASRGMTQSRIE